MMQRHALVSLLLCAVIALFQVSSALSQSMSSYAGKYNLQFAAQNSVVQSIPPGRTISLSVEQLPDDSNMYRLSIKVANILMSSFKIISTNENGEETIKCGPVASTRMMPPPELEPLEFFFNDYFPQLDYMDLVDNTLIMKGAGAEIKWTLIDIDDEE
jgi:hypothetical protein